MWDSFKRFLLQTFYQAFLPMFGVFGRLYTPLIAVVLAGYEIFKEVLVIVWDYKIK